MFNSSSAAHSNVGPIPALVSAQQKRPGHWIGISCLCLLVAGIGTFTLDQLLREPDTAPGNPTERGPESPTEANVARGNARPRYHDGPSEKIPVGGVAPDFRLSDLDGHEVHLASLRSDKPVILIFGSFSCNVLIGELAKVKRFDEANQDQANFLFVYIDEAGHSVAELEPELAALPKEPEKRWERAHKGRDVLRLNMPMVVDTPEGTVQSAYDAWPRRLVVVDTNGRIAVDLGRGLGTISWDFAKVEAWLRADSP